MTWDYAELNPLLHGTGSFLGAISWTAESMDALGHATSPPGKIRQADAGNQDLGIQKVVSTDPPYYNNIGYADLSDFFYVWLRHSLRSLYPDLFATLAVPKFGELVATPYRHGSKQDAERFFLDGMTNAIRTMTEQAHPAFPITIYYAFKQAEKKDAGVVRTGWETFLGAVMAAGLGVGGTWPVRTELSNRMVGMGVNALASSVVLACRPHPPDRRKATWREFVDALKHDLPRAVIEMRRPGIAPVDLAQAAIGPGMAVFTRFSSVLYSSGKKMTVGEALALINQVLDETLAEQEGDFDADTRWALAWFTQHHFDEADSGIADTLSRAKNTSVAGLEKAGILRSGGGRVRLLRPEELPEDWDPMTDRRLTVWEMVHHLVRVLEGDGELAAGQLLRRIGGQAEAARDLAYRLYAICDRQKRAAEARVYNSLVTSWPELARLAREDHGRQQRLQ